MELELSWTYLVTWYGVWGPASAVVLYLDPPGVRKGEPGRANKALQPPR